MKKLRPCDKLGIAATVVLALLFVVICMFPPIKHEPRAMTYSEWMDYYPKVVELCKWNYRDQPWLIQKCINEK